MCAYVSDLRACLYGQFVFLNVCPGKNNFFCLLMLDYDPYFWQLTA